MSNFKSFGFSTFSFLNCLCGFLKTAALLAFFVFLGACSPKKNDSSSAKDALTKVEYIEATEDVVNTSSEILGRVRPFKIAQIRPQVSGIILERLFTEGSYVEEGQQLYQIDPARYKVAYNMASGQLAKAKANLASASSLVRRYKSLVDQKAVSNQEYDDSKAKLNEIKANISIASAEVESAEINLKYTKVLAPISGYIGKSEVTKGALVSALQDKSLSTIRTLDPVYIDLSQSVSEAMDWKAYIGNMVGRSKEPVSVVFKVEGGQKLYPEKGKLETAEFSVNEDSGSLSLRAIVANPNTDLLPGMFVKAYIENTTPQKKILVPQLAISRSESGEARVWLINENNEVNSVRVETGPMRGKDWIIESGLKAGMKVAVDNFYNLKPNMKVEPILKKQAEETQNEKLNNDENTKNSLKIKADSKKTEQPKKSTGEAVDKTDV